MKLYASMTTTYGTSEVHCHITNVKGEPRIYEWKTAGSATAVDTIGVEEEGREIAASDVSKGSLTARGTAHGERLFVRGRRWRVKQNDVIFTSRTPAEQMCTHARQEMGRLPWQPASIHHGRRA